MSERPTFVEVRLVDQASFVHVEISGTLPFLKAYLQHCAIIIERQPDQKFELTIFRRECR